MLIKLPPLTSDEAYAQARETIQKQLANLLHRTASNPLLNPLEVVVGVTLGETVLGFLGDKGCQNKTWLNLSIPTKKDKAGIIEWRLEILHRLTRQPLNTDAQMNQKLQLAVNYLYLMEIE